MNQESLLFDANTSDDNEKYGGDMKLAPSQQTCFWCTKLICTIFMFISGVTAAVLALAVPATFTIFTDATTDFRTGAIVAPNAYPTTAIQTVGSVDIGLLAAFVSILAFLSYLFNVLFHSAEVEQMTRGVNPYVWVFQLLWTPVAFLTVGFLSGFSNVFVATAVPVFTWAWIFIWWFDDLLTSNGYLAAVRQYEGRNSSFFSAGSLFSWIPFAASLFFAIAAYAFLLVYLGFTFSATITPSTFLIAPPLAVLFFYLGVPVIVGLSGGGWFIDTIYARDLALYIYGGWIVTLTTWGSLGLIAAAS